MNMLQFFLFLLVASLSLASRTVALTAREPALRCKVCDRTIAHIWHTAVKLRKHCRLHGTDKRCRHTNVENGAVSELVRDACQDVAKSHHAKVNQRGHFEMVETDGEDSANDPDLDNAISDSCERWVLKANSESILARFIFANLDAGKTSQAVLSPLQSKFCKKACESLEEDQQDEL